LKKFTLFLIATLALLFLLYARVANLYYAKDIDYLYNFDKSSAKVIRTKLKQNTLLLQDIDSKKYDTAFLKVDIKHSFLGSFLPPHIDLKNKKNKKKSYFNIGANGIRYINISSLLGSKEITLETHKISFLSDNLELILFKKHNLENKTILIIAPHPDDAEIASFGLYSHFAKNSYIITITAGDSGEIPYPNIYKKDTNISYFQKAKLRIINSFTTPMIGGLNEDRCLNLGYFDGELKKMFESPNKTFRSSSTNLKTTLEYRKFNVSSLINLLTTKENNYHSLVSDLSTLLKTIKPNIIVTPYPTIDAHSDHKYSSIALFDAIKSLGLKDIKLFLYTNHFIFDEKYPYGERFSTMNLPPIYKTPIYFEDIYSYNLTKNQQLLKILALDSMNDLRQNYELLDNFKMAKEFVYTLLKRVGIIGNVSYFRRAVKDNELFFVVDSNNLYNEKIYKKLTIHLPNR